MLPWLIALIQLLGILSAIRAVMDARTPQGAIAWAIALIAFPYAVLPLFWIFGKRKFEGYVIARRSALSESSPIAKQAYQALIDRGLLVRTEHARELPFERLAKLPFTTGNDAHLLIDGEPTFASIFAGIENARKYVLVQFYIFRDDQIGRQMEERLLDRVRSGVRVYLLYDEIGSHDLSNHCIGRCAREELRCAPFIRSADARTDFKSIFAITFAIAHREYLAKLVIINAPRPAVFERELRNNPLQQKASQYMLFFRSAGAEEILAANHYARLVDGILSEGLKSGAFTDEDKQAYSEAWSQPRSAHRRVELLPCGRTRAAFERDGQLRRQFRRCGIGDGSRSDARHLCGEGHLPSHEKSSRIECLCFQRDDQAHSGRNSLGGPRKAGAGELLHT